MEGSTTEDRVVSRVVKCHCCKLPFETTIPEKIGSFTTYPTCKKCQEEIGVIKQQAEPSEDIPNTQRLKILRVSLSLLCDMLQQREHQVFFRGMPADAKIVGVSDQLYFLHDELALKIWSGTFPIVGNLATIPELVLTVSRE